MELEELKSIWKTYNQADTESLSQEAIEQQLKKRSKSTLSKIRRNMIFELVIGWILTPIFLWVAFYQELNVVVWGTVLLQVLMILITWTYIKAFQKAKQIFQQDVSLKTRLTKFISYFQKGINLGLKINFIMIPFLSAIGMLLGFSFSAQEEVYTKLATPRIQIILILAYGIYTALCYPYIRWVFRKLYGKNLQKLKLYLSELENSE